MKSLITIFGLIAFGSMSASAPDHLSFAKYSPVEEDFVNPFELADLQSIDDTIRRNRQITKEVIEVRSPDSKAEREIEQGARITEWSAPACQPLDWSTITQDSRDLRNIALIKTHL